MTSTHPEAAFQHWLRASLGRALRAIGRDGARPDPATQSVGDGDAKRRLKIHQFFC